MNKKKIRDFIRLSWALIFSWIYLPHICIYLFTGGGKTLIYSDLNKKRSQINIGGKFSNIVLLLYFLHNDRYFRSWFYYRIGPLYSSLIRWIRPGDPSFTISYTTKIESSVLFAHPFATVINAESIGRDFYFLHCTTLGAKDYQRPKIGNNVTLGANVNIIGGITIGDNVTIGAGSVVVKDIPSNCIAAGNPAKVIRYKI